MKATFQKIIELIDKVKDASDAAVSSAKNVIFRLYEDEHHFDYLKFYGVYVSEESSEYNGDGDYHITVQWTLGRLKSVVLEVFSDGTFDSWAYDSDYRDKSNDVEWLRNELKDIPDLE